MPKVNASRDGELSAPSANAVVASRGPNVVASFKLVVSEAMAPLELGAVGFTLASIGVYALHALCVFYFIAAGKIYAYIPTTTVLAWEMDNYIHTVPTKFFNGIATTHFVFAALHAALLVLPIARIVLRYATPWRASRLSCLHQDHRVASLNTVVRRSTASLFGWTKVFSAESEHFEVIFVLREMLEVVLQSMQAYQMSIHIPRLVLNRVFVTLLVLNCWSTLLVHRVVKGTSQQRMLCLLADLLLDFVVSIGIPIVLSASYIQDFDVSQRRFTFEFAYIDKWFVNYINEGPIIMLGSWTDAVSRLIFSLSLVVGMYDVQMLIKKRPSGSVAPSRGKISTAKLSPNAKSERTGRLVSWGHRLMALYGFGVLVVHVYAEWGSPPEACVIPVRPWLTRRKGCALIEFNCHPRVPYRVSSSGAATMKRVLSALDAPSLAQLSVRHCQDVEMVPELQRFQNLLAMKLYNVTVLSWGSNAALHRDFHERLCIVYIVYTTFPSDELPPGLLSPSFPDQLLDVEFSFTRLRKLPSNLHELWHKQMVLYFENCGWNEVPSVILEMQPFQLFLVGNPIKSMPIELFYSPDFNLLAIGATAVKELPSAIDLKRLKGQRRLRMEKTNISALPDWMNEAYVSTNKVFAADTPICESIRNGTALIESPWLDRMDCTLVRIPVYPLSVELRDDEPWE
ncbi:hypothetical protein PINS_up006686 [Pythium insidiosum]|nr:hypothetical protein PINS_up006686 [Pythium insidiosum]